MMIESEELAAAPRRGLFRGPLLPGGGFGESSAGLVKTFLLRHRLACLELAEPEDLHQVPDPLGALLVSQSRHANLSRSLSSSRAIGTNSSSRQKRGSGISWSCHSARRASSSASRSTSPARRAMYWA